ncbi:nitrate- and nitrite sensing domain-containing protein [Streptomyces sp. GMY02]|uniref:sensor histidine kinase n=1 Tax=Streptomyces sp. GMY02 TaxID=1333528 RepID=UPI001C2C88F8|nr:nitrate- and nitrite sensing domain-containing protein [Streptomyces sp. GMY02]QXE39045.1 nitrate- and nitrite sensing domain-containing protein [Streptomyces sp. GMY02]
MGTGGTVPEGRRVRVRTRLVAGVAVVGMTVIAAGTPAVLNASAELNDAQRLVTLAELNQQAVILSHSLADERDEVIVYIAAGREEQPDPEDNGSGGGKDLYTVSEARSARVDRQIDEIRAAASASPGLLHDLSTVPSIRRTALTGKGSALEAYRAYSDVIAKLQALADELAEKTPAEVADGTRAPGALGRAVEQASATRGLLMAALAIPAPTDSGPQYDPVTGLPVESGSDSDSKKNDQLRDELTAAAQQSRVRELAALADFDQTADTEASESLAATVTGPDVKTAERYLTRFTDQPELSDADREADQDKAEAALSARVDQMRGVESGLGSRGLERLEKLRDDGVTGLELRIALLGGCLLVAVGVSTAVARTLTRPLAVLRIGAARLAAAPATETPVVFTGRNDEFAQVVRSLNGLHSTLLDLSARAESLDGDRTDLIGAREKVAAQRVELQERTAEIAAQLQRLRHTVHHTFVNLSLRTLGLVERQLAVIEGLEEDEQDPQRLDTLFKLDHMATVMRRHSENLLVLAGHDHGRGSHGPVPLVDVLRAAVSEIERYERVTIQSLPPHSQVAGFAADDLSHLVAELLENATSFSPPEAEVQLSGWLLESGEVMLSVQDQGIGMSPDRLAELNARLANPEDTKDDPLGGVGLDGRARKRYGNEIDGEGLGLRVAALLAARHGVRIELREHEQGGVAAVLVLPPSLLPASPQASPQAAAPHRAAPATVTQQPEPAAAEALAETSSPGLPGGSEPDPLVVAAEEAIRKAEAEAAETADASETEAAETVESTEPAESMESAESAEDEPGTDPLPTRGIRKQEPESGPLTAQEPEEPEPARESEQGFEPEQSFERERGTRSETEPEPESGRGLPAARALAVPDPAPLPGPYAIGPDRHERVRDGESETAGPDQDTFTMPLPRRTSAAPKPATAPATAADTSTAGPGAAPRRERTTGKGLPKRTPRVVQPAAAPTERTGSVDAEALRRRLGGFHQGAKDGRRDVEAELTERVAPTARTGIHTDETGETVEEARS